MGGESTESGPVSLCGLRERHTSYFSDAEAHTYAPCTADYITGPTLALRRTAISDSLRGSLK